MHRHFATAAAHCFVTQPTLSMMIQKLEDELGLKIFDRSKHPVIPTHEGQEIIKQAKTILAQAKQLKSFVTEKTEAVSGEIKLVVIPTLAPYVLPYFLGKVAQQHPSLLLIIREANTAQIIEMIKTGQADIGLLSTPLNENQIKEYPLFYEELLAYTDIAKQKGRLAPADLDPTKLWLLEEGHCFRSQILNYCELRKTAKNKPRLIYEAGSIQTLINMVDGQGGTTIIPQLAAKGLSPQQKNKLKKFSLPAPVREVSLITHRHFARTGIVNALKNIIIQNTPITTAKQRIVLDI